MPRDLGPYQVLVGDDPSGKVLVPGQQKNPWPWGGSKELTSSGLVGAFPSSNQEQDICSLPKQPVPSQWCVSTKGVVNTAPPAIGNIVALAVFRVVWQIGGQNFETLVDGNSDQYLSIFAESIQVKCAWDAQNFAIWAATANPQLPLSMGMSASIAQSDGALTVARRTVFLPIVPAAFPTQVLIEAPYAARSFNIIGTQPIGAYLQDVIAVFGRVGAGTTLDLFDPVALQSAHDRGSPLPLASIADSLLFDIVAAPLGGACEFLVQP